MGCVSAFSLLSKLTPECTCRLPMVNAGLPGNLRSAISSTIEQFPIPNTQHPSNIFLFISSRSARVPCSVLWVKPSVSKANGQAEWLQARWDGSKPDGPVNSEHLILIWPSLYKLSAATPVGFAIEAAPRARPSRHRATCDVVLARASASSNLRPPASESQPISQLCYRGHYLTTYLCCYHIVCFVFELRWDVYA